MEVLRKVLIGLLASAILSLGILIGSATSGNSVAGGFAEALSAEDMQRVSSGAMIEEADVEYMGEYEVYIVRGASAKRLLSQFGASVIVNTEQKYILLLQIEA